MGIALSPQQEAARAAFFDWLNSSFRKPVFRMFGYAGTGKTTLAGTFLAEAGLRAQYAAFTGKAASVMRGKGMDNATTLHSLAYVFAGLDADKRPTFSWAGERSPLYRGTDILIIDECSMVGSDLAHDILRYKVPIVVIGDPAQLPPVSGTGKFVGETPDVMLTEIHRQESGNPIVAMATTVRTGGTLEPGAYGDSSVVRSKRVPEEALFAADQVLVGTNAKRTFLNRKFRRHMGIDDVLPVFGEKLICLRNSRELGIYNGEMFRVMECRPDGKSYLRMDLLRVDGDGERLSDVRVQRGCFDDGVAINPLDNSSVTMDFGYAITVHKSQGSQWDNVVLADESSFFRADASKWLYTGITRAAKSITVVQGV